MKKIDRVVGLKVAVLAGEGQHEMAGAVAQAARESDLGYEVVGLDEECDLRVLVGYAPDVDLVQEYGWQEAEDPYSARLLEAYSLQKGLEIGRYVVRVVAARGDNGLVVAERDIYMGPNCPPEQMAGSLNWVMRSYLPGDIGKFLEKQRAGL